MSETDPRHEERSGNRIDAVDHVSPAAVPSHLQRLEAVSGDWLDDRADLFDLHEWETHDEYQVRRKAFSELALYLLLGDHLPVEPAADVAAGRDVVIEAVNDRRYRQALRRNPNNVRAYGYPPIFAKRAGELRDDATWAALGDVLGREFVWAKDRRPFALLDLWHMATLYGIEPPYDRDTILRTSSLDIELHPIWAELKDIYPLTHDLMFYRGFGMDGLGFPTEPAPHDVELSHRGLVLRFLADRKYDAMIELLTSGVLQRAVPPDLVGLCLDRLVRVAEAHGHVPDYTVDDDSVSTINQDNVEVLDHLDDRTVDWGAQYHANVVAGYAGLCIRSEWDALLDAYADRDPPAYEPENLLLLGEALERFAAYDLKGGARKLQAVSGTPAAEAYPAVFRTAVSFLCDQRRDDGEFGYWAEEEMKFERLGHDPNLFDEKMVAPTTDACEAALRAIDSDGGPCRR